LQGIAICSSCGCRLSATYKTDKNATYWQYVCKHTRNGEPFSHKNCICISGRVVDQAVSEIILKRLTPEAIKAANEVREELNNRKLSEDQYFVMQIEKAKYETELARKRYMHTDPENRLVAAELERLWNDKMNQLAKAEDDFRKFKCLSKTDHKEPGIEELFNLPERLKNAWQNNNLNITEKKRIVRCLAEDATLAISGDEIIIGIRFKGGLTECIKVRRPLKKHETWTTDPETVEYIKEASKKYAVDEIVRFLNANGKKSGKGLDYTLASVRGIQYSYDIPSLKNHLKSNGYLSTKEKAKQMGISPNALNKRRASGEYNGHCIRTNGSGDYMYAP